MAIKSKVDQLVDACKKTSLINRGAYPITKASNVFKEDGSSLENKSSEGNNAEDSKVPDEGNGKSDPEESSPSNGDKIPEIGELDPFPDPDGEI